MESNMKFSERTIAILVRFGLGTVFAVSAARGLHAQQNPEGMPHMQNARVESHTASGQLAAEIKNLADQSAQPQWIAYAVPEVPSDRQICCHTAVTGMATAAVPAVSKTGTTASTCPAGTMKARAPTASSISRARAISSSF